MPTAGGLLLGLLGALGGHVTLFKGLDEVKELSPDPSGRPAGQFATMAVVRTAALAFAATCGFRVGRIFPARARPCAGRRGPLALAVPSAVLGPCRPSPGRAG
jgi:hypothetical protein